jgi:RNA polymerase sigma-70 factor (sigma-E family)
MEAMLNAMADDDSAVDVGYVSDDFRIITGRTADQEFVAFVESAGQYLFSVAFLLAGNRAAAEDMVQEAFERVYRMWHKVRDGDPRAYARRTLVNLRTDTWRRTRREVLQDPADQPVDGRVAADSRLDVVRALHGLPERQRRVIVLRHLVDLTEAETARELNLSIGSVKSANARGLDRLRELLGANISTATKDGQP